MTDTKEAKPKKQGGYRIRVTLFVPCDLNNLDSITKATTFAKTCGEVPEGAPEGTVVERFKNSHGYAGEAD